MFFLFPASRYTTTMYFDPRWVRSIHRTAFFSPPEPLTMRSGFATTLLTRSS